ncbi:hypothetical protein JKA74_16905 [Marivirga sp. S37H4]|uniref:Uncharacterized protein n=1 Tax=Marivirga aurantiaca TaxID=2802615 RepID=A0A935CDB0_9BACT|nr:hypothetical protein [Marivirga aurantiaca]MBK6266728.1 hypothetical protein [Marivirga aurantiaca]
MLKKRVFVGFLISLIQILLFYCVYRFLWLSESIFGLSTERTVFENLFLDWFVNDYVLVFGVLIVLQNTLIIITWRKNWTLILRIVTSILHSLFWLENMQTLKNESIILGISGLLLIWLGPIFENILISIFNIKHPYKEQEFYEDLDIKK